MTNTTKTARKKPRGKPFATGNSLQLKGDKAKKGRYEIREDFETLDRWKRQAKERGVSLADAVREAIDTFFKQ